MLTDLIIEDYQAIRRLRLKLGRLTVVTGPTGSGKSAVLRALRLVAFNARGTSYIRRGAKKCAVLTGDQEQGWAVAIHRGGRGSDRYRLSFIPQSGDEPHVDEFTKLAGGVPEEVTAALQLTPLNFASQFDRPYLLDETGSQVARTLGELTNVTLIFEAAREASRRKQGIAADLKRAEARVEELREQARSFAGLPAQRQAVAQAMEYMTRAQALDTRRSRLIDLSSRVLQERAVASGAQQRFARHAAVGTAALEQLQQRYWRLRCVASEWYEAQEAISVAEERRQLAVREETKAHFTLHKLLADAGICPTCGQEVKKEWTSQS